MNVANFERDELEQYGQKESFRIINVPELPLEFDNKGRIAEKEDSAKLVIEAARLMDIEIKKSDIQRVHRVGRRKKPAIQNAGQVVNPKPRQIIVRMKDYSQRQSVLKAKKSLQENATKNGMG